VEIIVGFHACKFKATIYEAGLDLDRKNGETSPEECRAELNRQRTSLKN